jgi:hypothetical protein
MENHEPGYIVLGVNGKESPPIPQSEIFNLVRSGTLLPKTKIREVPGYAWMNAGEHPALAALFRQRGVDPNPPAPVETKPKQARAYPWSNTVIYAAAALWAMLSVAIGLNADFPVEVAGGLFGSWVGFSFGIGLLAQRRGHPFGWGFALSLWISPIFGALVVAFAPPNGEVIESRMLRSGRYKRCSACAEIIRAEAAKCRHCGTDLRD